MLISVPQLASDVLSSSETAGGSDTVVVDCRFDLLDPAAGRQAWLSGHIPGAQYADLDQDLAGPAGADTGRHPLPERVEFAGALGRLGVTPEKQVVVYDNAGGAIAARLWWLLRWMGHARVALLDGGLPAWEAAGLPLETDSPAIGNAHYVAESLQSEPLAVEVIAVEGVESGMANNELSLIDARDAARFAGDVEPIDTLAGHVPGAINRPFGENLNEQGFFKSPEQLRAEFDALLDSHPKAVASMCGSGVTACHNLFAMELAGLPPAKLYVGSWSGWISDAARPVAGSEGV